MHKSVKHLRKLNRRYSNKELGWRETEYAIIAEAMSEVIVLRNDVDALSEFMKLAGIKPPPKVKKSWVTREVVVYVTGATSDEARQIAWKRARILDYLVDVKGVDVDDIAQEIKKRGGVEALVREAAQQDPRRNKTKSAAAKSGGKVKEDEGHNEDEDQDENDDAGGADDEDDQGDEQEEQAEKDDDLEEDEKARDDDKDTMVISINARLRKKFRKIDVRERAKLIGVRLNDDDGKPTFEVQRVVKVK